MSEHEADSDFNSHIFEIANSRVRPDLIRDEHKATVEVFQECCRFKTAAALGALLLDPRWQSNCVRVEALVHLAVLDCKGTSDLEPKQLALCFNELGVGICGTMEDPAEEVFVSRVLTQWGTFRVPQGIWESGVFYLQQIVDLVMGAPEEGEWMEIREAVRSMLVLSDTLCERAGLVANMVGGKTPVDRIRPSDLVACAWHQVTFTAKNLKELGISRSSLETYVFRDSLVHELNSKPLLHSPLQRFPILPDGDRIGIVLPSAISYAIRAAVIEFLLLRGFRGSLVMNLSRLYSRLFYKLHILGEFMDVRMDFFPHDGLPMAEVLCESEAGFYVHLLCFMDRLDAFNETGVAGQNTLRHDHSELLANRIQQTSDYANRQAGFRSGITLIVHCGIGRGISLPMPQTDCTNWWIEFISAPNLVTLSQVEDFTPLKLRKILEAEERLAKLGILLENPNGLLGVVAWITDNEGHIVPHAGLPKGFRKTRGVLAIDPTCLLDLRHQVAVEHDFVVAPRMDGSHAIVRRVRGSDFRKENSAPLFAEDHYSESDGIPLLYCSNKRYWWCHVAPSQRRAVDYEHWMLLKTWLTRIVPVIEPLLDRQLPSKVLLRLDIESDDSGEVLPIPSKRSISQAIRTTVDHDNAVVSIAIGIAFQNAQASPVNTAERLLVRAICQGFSKLGNLVWNRRKLDELETAIVPNDDARHMHRFQARTFRDYVAHDLVGRVIYLDELDVADMQLGLAFRIEPRLEGRATIRSKPRCTQFLNKLVRHIEEHLCAELRSFGRASLVEAALRNYERAILQRRRWLRTARANLALHGDDPAALNVIARQEGELSGILLFSLLLVEVAICECPLDGATKATKSDIARIMAIIHSIVSLSGWSDAIYWGAMPPLIAIRPLGAVHADTAFHNDVVMPFTERAGVSRVHEAIDSYEENFEPVELQTPGESEAYSEFEHAWNQEFGFQLDDLLHFVDAIEEIGIHRKSAVFEITKAELVELIQNATQIADAGSIIDALTLIPREGWRTLPEDLRREIRCTPQSAREIQRQFEKDILLGRFRRQLSAIRRPLFSLETIDNPRLVVAPGHIRDGVVYIARGYFDGSFPAHQLKSRAMRQWSGKQADARGRAFAQRVATRIRSMGWKTDKTDLEIKTILGRGTDPTFGDLNEFGDVDVLAWNEATNRILVIECKDLHYHKTAGEIAEQLSDYRGELRRDGKKKDDLLKHLNRLAVLNANRQGLCERVGLAVSATIEGWIIFSNPVPMLYSWQKLESHIRVATFDDIGRILNAA